MFKRNTRIDHLTNHQAASFYFNKIAVILNLCVEATSAPPKKFRSYLRFVRILYTLSIAARCSMALVRLELERSSKADQESNSNY